MPCSFVRFLLLRVCGVEIGKLANDELSECVISLPIDLDTAMPRGTGQSADLVSAAASRNDGFANASIGLFRFRRC